MPAATAPPASDSRAVPPRHVAVIMDGNGRWATERHLPRVAGHSRGVDAARATIEACAEREVAIVAYSSLGTGRHLGNRTVVEIAQRVGRTAAQVLLRWCLQRDAMVIPKSTHRERIEENAQLFDFALSDADLAALDALDRTGGTDAAQERAWW